MLLAIFLPGSADILLCARGKFSRGGERPELFLELSIPIARRKQKRDSLLSDNYILNVKSGRNSGSFAIR